MLDTSKIQIEIDCDDVLGQRADAIVSVRVTDDIKASQVLSYMRSGSFKTDIATRWSNKNAPGYGISLQGGPYPVFEKEGDRTSPVVKYSQSLSLVKWD